MSRCVYRLVPVMMVLAAILVASGGCTMFRGKSDHPATQIDATTDAGMGQDNEATLREAAQGYIAAASRESQDGRSKVYRARPYFYREYVEYPEGQQIQTVDIQETESRTAPFIGQVQVAKIRYATHLHHDRGGAASDANFLRSTGVETITFELKTGKWRRVGSLFVADRVEENVNGEWVPAREEVRKALSEENQDEGFFGRVWSSVFGR